MGSSKHTKPGKRPTDLDLTVAAFESARTGREQELLALIQSQHAQLVRLAQAVSELAEARAVAERQLERVLAAQQRTNALLELLAGSAFDLELREPVRR